MQIASLLVAASTLVTPAPTLERQTPAGPIVASFVDDSDSTGQRLPILPRGTSGQPMPPAPHRLGLGGSFTMTNYGAGAAFRYWFNDHLGTSVDAGWYRSRFQSSSGDRHRVVRLASTATWLFGTADAGSVANVRPYVGGGALYIDRSAPLVSTTARTSGTGPLAYGGFELTFQDYPGLSINNEVVYTGLPSELIGRNRDRVEYRISILMYLR
jgi:hypothetical protein